MPSTEETRKLIDTSPDFVNAPRFGNSLNKLLEKYPDGAPDRVVAQALMMTQEEVDELLKRVLYKLRTHLED